MEEINIPPVTKQNFSFAKALLNQHGVRIISASAGSPISLVAGVPTEDDEMAVVSFYQAIKKLESIGFHTKTKTLKASGSIITKITLGDTQ